MVISALDLKLPAAMVRPLSEPVMVVFSSRLSRSYRDLISQGEAIATALQGQVAGGRAVEVKRASAVVGIAA